MWRCRRLPGQMFGEKKYDFSSVEMIGRRLPQREPHHPSLVSPTESFVGSPTVCYSPYIRSFNPFLLSTGKFVRSSPKQLHKGYRPSSATTVATMVTHGELQQDR